MSERYQTASGGSRSGAQALAVHDEDVQHGEVKGRTQREFIWRRFKRHRLAMAGGTVFILLYAAVLLTPWISPYEFDEPDYGAIYSPPSLEHPMGTDSLGRDELTRVLYGGRVSLTTGLCVGVISTLIGTIIGIISGYYGRVADVGLMAVTDFMLILPFIPLMLVLGTLFRFTPVTISLALGFLLWQSMARLVRSATLSVREQEYVEAARAVGVSDVKIMVRHILPNVIGVVVVVATLLVAQAIIAEAAISYLGFGIQPPTPSWGNMLEGSRGTMTTQWWLTVFPGVMIVITALCVNFIGDGLRDALDPKAVE